ncbi:hypothetical protein M404DRAFT_994221, partial [Pisolithus tinctorius Marx 270]
MLPQETIRVLRSFKDQGGSSSETTGQNVRQVVSLDITIAHRHTPFPKAAVNEPISRQMVPQNACSIYNWSFTRRWFGGWSD